MRENLFIIALLVAALAVLVPCSGLEDSAGLAAGLNAQMIPVETIAGSNETVSALYHMEGMIGPEEFGEDILYIMGAVAAEYPLSSVVRVDCFIGDDPVRYYEADTANITAYSVGALSDAGMKSAIVTGTPDAAMKERVRSLYALQGMADPNDGEPAASTTTPAKAGNAGMAISGSIGSVMIATGFVIITGRERIRRT